MELPGVGAVQYITPSLICFSPSYFVLSSPCFPLTHDCVPSVAFPFLPFLISFSGSQQLMKVANASD